MDIRIDRLRLQVSGMHADADVARELGRLLAEHLAAALVAAPPASDAARLTGLRVSVPWPAGQHPGDQCPGGPRPAAGAPAAAARVARALREAAAGNAGATR